MAKCCSKCSLCIMYCHRDVNCLSSAFDHVQGLGYQLCILYTQTHTVSARPSITSRDSAISSVSCTHRHTPSQLSLQSRPRTRLSAPCPVHTDRCNQQRPPTLRRRRLLLQELQRCMCISDSVMWTCQILRRFCLNVSCGKDAQFTQSQ